MNQPNINQVANIQMLPINVQQERIRQPNLLFYLVLLCDIYTSNQAITFIFFVQNYQWKNQFLVLIVTSIVRICIWSINVLYIKGNANKNFFSAFFSIDIMSILGYCCILPAIALRIALASQIHAALQPLAFFSYIFIFLLYWVHLGNFKLTILQCRWENWQSNLFKIKSLLSSLCLMFIGIYFSFQKFNNDNCSPCLILFDEPDHEVCQLSCKKSTDCCLDKDNLLVSIFSVVNQFFIFMLAALLAFTSEAVEYQKNNKKMMNQEREHNFFVEN